MFGRKTVSDLVASGNPYCYLSLNIKIFRSVGLWPAQNSNRILSTFSWFISFPIFIILLYTVFFISELVDVYLKWGDVQSVTETLCIAFTMLNMTCKMIHFITKRKQIHDLIGLLKISCNFTEDGNASKTNILRGCISHARNITLSGWVMVVITAIIWGAFGLGQTSPNGTPKLPMRAWYPFDETVSPNYEIASTIQIFTLCCMPYTYISFTTFYVVLIIHACGNFKIVNLSLRTMRDRALAKGELESTETASADSAAAGRRSLDVRILVNRNSTRRACFAKKVDGGKLHECLAETIKCHQSALRFCKELLDIYQPVILIQLMSSLLIIGQVGYQALALSSQPIGMMKFLSYFGCALFELLLFCWYSNELSVQECSVAEAAYSCQWFEFPQSAKKTLLIMMIRAQRSVNETKNCFFKMSCLTCTTILKNSYSIFTLLIQLSDTRE